MKKINLLATNIHFIGIGGVSMSGLAEVLQRDGYTVTGSDNVKTTTTDHLQSIGIPVLIPNAASNITSNTDMIVYTAAIKPDNPEYIAAKATGKPMLERAALLGIMLQGFDRAICIAGSHGKTSAMSLMAEILLDANLDPTISIGGFMARTGTNYRTGDSGYFLLEACEYNNSYHHWHPHIGVILNIDADHLDFFKDFNGVVASFQKFAANIRPSGALVALHGSPVTAPPGVRMVTFGETHGDFTATNIAYDKLGRPSFDIAYEGVALARINLPLPGRYNMLNALAVFAASHMLGITPNVAAYALSNAKGVKRRFEYKGIYNGAHIIDDYAHHPTEIRECLTAARKGTKGRLICIFQPHTYTRTRNHLQEFAESFGEADMVLLLPIFAAREPFDPTISSLNLLEKMKAATPQAKSNCKHEVSGHTQNLPPQDTDTPRKDRSCACPKITHFHTFPEAIDFLRHELTPGDMLITMGAGNVYFIGESLLEA